MRCIAVCHMHTNGKKGAPLYVACTGMYWPRWNADYFNSLVVSTIHSQKKLRVGFLFSFSIKLLIRLDLGSPSLPNMVGMTYDVSLTLFMSYPTDRAIDGEITNIRSSKCLPQSFLWQISFDCNMLMFRSQSRKRVLFWGDDYSIHWQTYLHNYMWQNTPFYTFNKTI